MQKTRSPNFPAIELGRAIALAEKLYAVAQRHALPADTLIREHWGMSPTSSGAKQSLAALRAFGLIEVDGVGEHRKVRVTDAAAKIIENHSSRPQLLREAALKPKVYRSTWESCSKEGDLPPDAAIQHYLLFDHDPRFNKASTALFIKQFRDTLSFAGVLGSDKLPPGDGEPDEEGEEGPSVDEGANLDQKRKLKPPHQERRPAGMHQDVFTLPEGEMVIHWPARLSERSFKRAKAWLDLMAMKLEDSVSEEPIGEPDESEEP